MNQSRPRPCTMNSILSLIAASSVLVSSVATTSCQLPPMTFPNPSEKYLPDTVGCNYPIQEHHNWSLVNLQLPAVADPANPDWKDMFRKSVDHPSCLQLRVSYTINQNIGLHFLDIGVECHGEPKTHPVKFQMMDRVQGSEGFFLSVEYRGGGVALDPDCIKFGSQQQFELEVGKSLRIVQNATFMTIGEASGNVSDDFEPCDCASIRAYELILKECHIKGAKQPLIYEKSEGELSLAGNTVKSSADDRVWLVSIILISVGVLLVAIIYGSKCIESDNWAILWDFGYSISFFV